VDIIFMDRNTFNAAEPSAHVETWDTVPSGTVIPNGTMFNGITYNSSAGDAVVTSAFLALSPPNGLGRTPQDFFGPGDTMTFTFPVAINVFGISINTFATMTGDYLLTTNRGSVVPSFFNPFPGAGTGQFAGFITTQPFTSITISAPGGFSYTLDNLTFAATPEPGTVGLFGLGGLVLLSCYVRYRRRGE
jgi:hypothetical protein